MHQHFLFHCSDIFSSVLRNFTPCFVGLLVRPSIHLSHFTFFGFLWSLALLLLPKWSSDLKYGPCPPARNWGSRVSGLVHCRMTSFPLGLIPLFFSFVNSSVASSLRLTPRASFTISLFSCSSSAKLTSASWSASTSSRRRSWFGLPLNQRCSPILYLTEKSHKCTLVYL